MNAQDWEKIKELFARVLEQPADLREVFLNRACTQSNEHLRAEVESLLAAHDETERHLIENKVYAAAFAFKTNGEAANYSGKQFGNYRINREIGRGGMGAVFLAERTDGEFEQQVALKIVRQSFADRELENRFRRERQILAAMNHQNIAKLLDGGVSERGELFLVMEYIAGETILEYADEQRLGTEDRLRLFLKICAAVAYAHRNLIVHRDIKPSNILVTKDGEPKLLDFGLAKILDESLLDASQTETAFRAFTPAYASPEQMHGKRVTTASDVYSLGVILYELLTGEKPFRFEHKSYEEILRSIDALEPPRPSSVVSNQWSMTGATRLHKQRTMNEARPAETPSRVPNPKSLEGDLDNIVLMALRKEPERRYESVEQFARDIERHLQSLPILARPQTAVYRAAKFFRRNKLAVSAVAAVILALTAGLNIAIWQANVARRERDRAAKRFADVRELSNALLADIAPKIERLEGATEAREALVAQSLKYLDSLAEESQDDAALQAELAAAYEKVADLQGSPRKPNLGNFSGAIESYEKAQAIRRKLLEKNPGNAENLLQVAANYKELVKIRWWINDYPSSLKASEAALRIYEKMIAEQSGSIALRLAEAEAHIDVGMTHRFNNQYARAFPYLEKAIGALEKLSRQSPPENHDETLRLLARAYTEFAISLSWESRQPEAEAEMKKALAIIEQLAAKNANDVILRNELWLTYMQSSSLYEESGDKAKDLLSHEFALKALRLAEETAARDRADVQARQNLAKSYSRLGITSSNLFRLAEAVSYCEKGLAIFAELERNEPKNLTYKADLGRAYVRLGDAKFKLRTWPGSLAAFENAAAIYENLVKADSTNTLARRDQALTYKNIGHIHRALAQTATGEKTAFHLQTAKKNYQRAFDILSNLQAQNALAGVDRKLLEEMKVAVEKNEKWP